MVARVLTIAVIAGLVAGIIVTGAQFLRVFPLIQKAETYEQTAPAESHTHGAASQGAHSHEASDWAPDDGLERTVFTLLANILTAVGFALLLNAAFAIYGRPIGLKQGVVWGLAGFAVFALAPAIGLPPELPGLQAAELFARQTWYFGTILATGAGLAAIVFLSHWAHQSLGAISIVAPHLIGAPHPAEFGGSTPPELAAMFVIASLSTTALLWIVLGGISGYLHDRFANTA